ncbi:hypothetical protein [Prescottella equi]|uniref:hypothetical protein n=1 Tax=Rhodococcus hoagii TaxID=43767 RepID=UPI001E39DBB8|nr:hypothetical protein [Prescottella equi]MCD7053136.1 hypothetical protein [Rhodococcus sp. BH2-1]MDP8017641.1 hypothetical protein [Prescottella equi]
MTDRRTELEYTLTEAIKEQQLRDDRPLPDVRLLFPLAVAFLVCMLIGMFVPEDARVVAWAFWVAQVAIVVAFVGVCIAPFVRRYLADRRIKVLTEELIRVQAGEGDDLQR